MLQDRAVAIWCTALLKLELLARPDKVVILVNARIDVLCIRYDKVVVDSRL